MAFLHSIIYLKNNLRIVNQLSLPETLEYEEIKSTEDAYNAIKKMKIRGAPAIAILAMLSIALESKDLENLVDKEKLRRLSKLDYLHYLKIQCNYLCSARPTAVNIRNESDKLIKFYDKLIDQKEIELKDSVDLLIKEIEKLPGQDINLNKSIGKYGAEEIIKYWAIRDPSVQKFNILTICNTGSLATCGYGTALGIIRRLNELKNLNCCYICETRPYNQVVVGADRLVMNGDFANKIGTYQLAVLCKYFNVPFYVACPLSTIDTTKTKGDEIEIEERPSIEMKFVGNTRIAPDAIECYNPAFDIVYSHLISLIITEIGSIPADQSELVKLVEKYKLNK